MTMIHKKVISRDLSVSVFDETFEPRAYVTQIHVVEWQDRKTKRVIASHTLYSIRQPETPANIGEQLVNLAYDLLSESEQMEVSAFMNPFDAEEMRELHYRAEEEALQEDLEW